MDYEKKYKEALERASKLRVQNPFDTVSQMMGHIFPELKEDERIRKDIIWCLKHSGIKESNPINPHVTTLTKDAIAWLEKQGQVKEFLISQHENKTCKENDDSLTSDERIRKAVIEMIHDTPSVECEKNYNVRKEDVLAWLEKQCEQKPFDYEHADIRQKDFAPKPKFKVGNWYQCTKDFFGKGVTFDRNTAYYCAKEGCLQNEYGCHIAIVKDLYDNFKLWNIDDAKNGDVLSYRDGQWIFIYKKQVDDNSFHYYSLYSTIHQDLTIDDSAFTLLIDEVVPATKEQRALLFQKMKEVGYEWDAEKKELKEVEQSPVDVRTTGYWHVEDVEQKPAWSEEDETKVESIIAFLKSPALCCMESNKGIIDENIKYLKSLKGRVLLQPKQD